MVDRSPRLRSRLRPLVVLLVGFTAFAALTPGSATAVNVSLYQHVVNGGWYTTNTARLAQSFATGADAVSVSTVQVFVRNTNESNSSTISGSSYTLAIYTDSSGSPGSLVGTVGSDPSMGAWAEGTSTYTLSTPIELTANTGYFMVMTGTGTASWKYDNTTISTDVTPAPTFRSLRSVNNGSWGSLGVSFSLSISGVAAAPATTTTEPSTTLAPTTAAPTTEPATTAAPTTEPATTAAPTTAAPTTAVPTTEPATTVAPTTATPTTATPTTAAPTTAAPTTAAPTTEAPTTTEPTTTAAPTTAEPATTAAPTTGAPTTAAPTTGAPTTSPASTVPGTVASPTTIRRPAPSPAPAPVSATTTSSSTPAATTSSTSTTTTVAPTTAPGTAEPSTSTPSTSTPTTVAPDLEAPVTTVGSLFGADPVMPMSVVLDLQVGKPVTEGTVTVHADGLRPGAPVTVTVFSRPQRLVDGSADSAGCFDTVTALPDGLGEGTHTVIVSSEGLDGSKVEMAGAFRVDAGGSVTAIAPARLLTSPVPGDERLTRALEYGIAPYDPRANPSTTAVVTVAVVSFLGLAGAGGLVRGSLPGTGTAAAGAMAAAATAESGKGARRGKGKLAGVVTKKLKRVDVDRAHWGDASPTWRLPLTERTDALSRNLPGRLGRFSAMLPRVAVDGAWARAMFGSASMLLWAAGAVLGALAAFDTGARPLAPALGLMLAIIALGMLDAAAGLLAWMVFSASVIVTGGIRTWHDVRLLLGLAVLWASLSLLTHVIRPLRRLYNGNTSVLFERVCDYVMPLVFVGFAGGSMMKALNGLSGLELTGHHDVVAVRWTVALSLIVRFAVEDVATHLYPERSKAVQPAKLVSPNRWWTAASIVMRSVVFVFVAAPFFGLTATIIVAALMQALPNVLKMWEDDLPNSVWLNKWLPRGLLRFFLLLLLGAYLSAVLIGHDGGDAAVRNTLLWMLLPSMIVGIVELFGRSGGTWPDNTAKRLAGAAVWLTAVGMVVGWVVPFR